ncbi:putative quinol monooxygenase [Devosia faecipullorum]|jgi:quinol monooxygenase YgiN|uniref:putative quinol monooxygenase n=1 Tax=Devosia faecipullorum TaxID=2755039 RepID=UPI00187B295D|nr:antibiotic biosynthesis monooxygenase [Devosia faecipullorum]MBE7734160.1 antibiotic biosynthesis monooxygenase [Devosia faecipullorum]
MTIQHGFHAAIPAHPGQGEALAALLLAAPSLGNDDCLVFLVSRSASNPDLVSVAEGWSSQDAHAKFFASSAAQAFVAQLAPLIAGEPIYSDAIPVGGKAILA